MQPVLSVKLQTFEGPLDLLLHLIDKNKVSIYDIPIAEITDQYMDYVREMDKEDLDLVSDFLVMAATLLDIKSRMLLPTEASEEEEEDPRQELVERLLEHKMYKYMAGELKDRQTDAQKLLFKPETIPEEVSKYRPPVDLSQLLQGVTLSGLEAVFQSVLRRQENRIDPVRAGFRKIEKEPFRVSVKIVEVLRLAAARKDLTFRELLEAQSDKVELIVTFLAVLELMKMGTISLSETEDGNFLMEPSRELIENTEELAAQIAANIDG